MFASAKETDSQQWLECLYLGRSVAGSVSGEFLSIMILFPLLADVAGQGFSASSLMVGIRGFLIE